MEGQIRTLLRWTTRWTTITRRTAIDLYRRCARTLPDSLVVLNDIYGVGDLRQTRR